MDHNKLENSSRDGNTAAAAAAKSLQSCLTLCDPTDGSPPGSPVPGILQARTLEWVAISFSNAGKWKVKVKSLSRVQLPGTPWTAAYQAPPSMGFSRQEYWSGLDYLICLLKNLYAGQEATVGTGHGTMDWFQIGKGVHARRNINNRRYADDSTLMEES